MKNPLKTNSVVKLQKQSQKQSQDALSIFEKTITRLFRINEKVVAEKTARVEKIDKLQGELDALVVSETKNDKLITKLSDFLED